MGMASSRQGLDGSEPAASGDAHLPLLSQQDATVLDMGDEPLSASSWPAAASDVRSRHRGATRTASVHRFARSSRSNLGKDGSGGSGTLTFFVRQSASGGINAELGSPMQRGAGSPSGEGANETFWEDDGVEHRVELPHELVHDTVHGAVGDAVRQALEDRRFDVRANFFTLVAIIGVILYWRGVWTLWDKLVGMSLASEIACIAVGLFIIVLFRFVRLPLLEGLPSG